MKTRLLSALNSSRPSCSASMTVAASGLPLRGDAVDALDRVAEAVGREVEQRVLVGPGACALAAAAQPSTAKRPDERHAAIAEEHTSSDVPAS